MQLVVFSLAGDEYALPIERVREVIIRAKVRTSALSSSGGSWY